VRVAALLTTTALMFIASSAAADPHQERVGHIILSSRVVRASIGHSPTSAAYLVIANTGDAPDELVSASCACAASVGIHASHIMGGMMMMSDVGPVTIPAHKSVSFAPGGLHLMLTGLKENLADGGEQTMTLTFKRQGPIKAAFHIRAQIDVGRAPNMADMPGMGR